MLSVRLPGTPVTCSRFILGTASLFAVGSGRARRALLEAAVDHGFTHFDTAPYYGFGSAERDLGAVLAAHASLTVTSKVGLYAPGGADQSELETFIRKAGGRLVRGLSRPALDFNLRAARQSLEGSLRRLRRDRIDLYLLHEPELAGLDRDEWLRWLDALVGEGKVGAFGIASTVPRILPFLDQVPALVPVLQAEDSLVGAGTAPLTARGRAPQTPTHGNRQAHGALAMATPTRAAAPNKRGNNRRRAPLLPSAT